MPTNSYQTTPPHVNSVDIEILLRCLAGSWLALEVKRKSISIDHLHSKNLNEFKVPLILNFLLTNRISRRSTFRSPERRNYLINSGNHLISSLILNLQNHPPVSFIDPSVSNCDFLLDHPMVEWFRSSFVAPMIWIHNFIDFMELCGRSQSWSVTLAPLPLPLLAAAGLVSFNVYSEQ